MCSAPVDHFYIGANRLFTPDEPNHVFASHITHVWTDEGWMSLAVTLGLFNREIVAWSVKPRVTADHFDPGSPHSQPLPMLPSSIAGRPWQYLPIKSKNLKMRKYFSRKRFHFPPPPNSFAYYVSCR